MNDFTSLSPPESVTIHTLIHHLIIFSCWNSWDASAFNSFLLFPMDGDGVYPHLPLLFNRDPQPHYANNTPFLLPFSKWILKIIIWTIFLAWLILIFTFPSNFAQNLFLEWVDAGTSGTILGLTATVFLLFSGPLLIITFLSVAYIIASSSRDLHKKKYPRYLMFSLWTFPVLVDGPFGVVSAAELIGMSLFAVYIIWAVSSYSVQNYYLVSTYDLPFREKSYLMMEMTGFSFGSIGLFFLAFLFLPVARGSFLLRLVDIPFEHATRYHVWLGHVTMLLFTIHGVCYLVAWAMQSCLLYEIFQWAATGVANLAGVISLLAGLLMWVTSLPFVREHYFEMFFYTHQLYVVFFVFLAFHVGDFLFSVPAGGIFLFLLDRFLRFLQSRKTVNVVSAKCLPSGAVEIVLSKPKNLRYNALSFIFVQVKELSLLQWHPFSVSSSPLDSENNISVLIKVLGEWTKNLRDYIASFPQESSQSHPQITASVEGPYGHESAYHLMYENLILVAGGIGISPFLAILRDVIQHIKHRKPCLPEKVLVIWAVKKSSELSLLYGSDLESIYPFVSDKLHLEIQTYVTQELDPPLEDGKVSKSMQCCYFGSVNSGTMSSLVGTGNNIWSGTYAIIPTVGFIIFLALTEALYIKPFGIPTSWFTGLLFLACMLASVVIFGSLLVVCWDLWERRYLAFDKCTEDNRETTNPEYYNNTTGCHGTFTSSITTQYGRRPDFQEIFHSIVECWGHVDVGVIVCGPSTLQATVAKECRAHNIRGRRNHPFFHFNSHSFDL